MFFPIIIPMFNRFDDDDDRCSNKHGVGCRCPGCLEKEKWENMPREYYQARYAIPKKFIYKNRIFHTLSIISLILGFCCIISPHHFYDFRDMNFFTGMLIPILIGFGIAIGGFIFFQSKTKWDFQCKDRICLTVDYYATDEDWDKILKEKGITKKYKLTEVETKWRYK